MKTLLITLRSTLASLFFLLLICLIVLQLSFTTFRVQNKRVTEMIPRGLIYEQVKDGNLKDNEIYEKLANRYIDDYINYVFYKRSFPTFEMDKENISDEERIDFTHAANNLKKNLNIDYSTIKNIRDINNFISNGSIYLLLNIFIFVDILIIIIFLHNYSKTLKAIGLGLSSGGLLSIILGFIMYKKISGTSSIINTALKGIFEIFLRKTFVRLSLIYIAIGIIIFIIPNLLKLRKNN